MKGYGRKAPISVTFRKPTAHSPKTALIFPRIMASPHVMGNKHGQGDHPLMNLNTPAAGTHRKALQNVGKHVSSFKTRFSYFRQ